VHNLCYPLALNAYPVAAGAPRVRAAPEPGDRGGP
jgi:hypothetical protein